jgi:hypothetical protein
VEHLINNYALSVVAEGERPRILRNIAIDPLAGRNFGMMILPAEDSVVL